MKTNLVLSSVVALAVAAGFTLLRPASAQPAATQPAMDFPIGLECVVTVEMQAWMRPGPPTPQPTSGFRSDFTIQGQMAYFGEGWVVIREGTFDTWVSRDRIVAIRASR